MNIINAENFKISKDTSLKILLLICIVSYVGFGFLSKISLDQALAHGVDINEMLAFIPYSFVDYYAFIVIFSGVLAGTYVVGEFDKGTIRNALSTGTSKSAYYFSKLYSQLLACFALTAISTVAFSVSTAIFTELNGGFYSQNILNLLVFFTVILIHLFSYSALFLMVAFLVRSVGGVIAICIVYAMIESLVVQLLMLVKIPTVNAIAQNMPVSILNNLSTYVKSDTILTSDFTKTIIPAFIIMVISIVIGLITFVKRDVR